MAAIADADAGLPPIGAAAGVADGVVGNGHFAHIVGLDACLPVAVGLGVGDGVVAHIELGCWRSAVAQHVAQVDATGGVVNVIVAHIHVIVLIVYGIAAGGGYLLYSYSGHEGRRAAHASEVDGVVGDVGAHPVAVVVAIDGILAPIDGVIIYIDGRTCGGRRIRYVVAAIAYIFELIVKYFDLRNAIGHNTEPRSIIEGICIGERIANKHVWNTNGHCLSKGSLILVRSKQILMHGCWQANAGRGLAEELALHDAV